VQLKDAVKCGGRALVESCYSIYRLFDEWRRWRLFQKRSETLFESAP